MRVGYGNGRWIRIDDDGLPGPLYLRFGVDRGRHYVTEMYLDGAGAEITQAQLRQLPVSAITAAVSAIGHDRDALDGRADLPSPDLSRLASYFATSFGSQANHWIAQSMWAQIAGSDVAQPPVKAPPPPAPTMAGPPPVPSYTGTLSEPFLRQVGDYYQWCVAMGRRPAPTIAEAIGGISSRTVQDWFYVARKAGIMPPAPARGRAG